MTRLNLTRNKPGDRGSLGRKWSRLGEIFRQRGLAGGLRHLRQRIDKTTAIQFGVRSLIVPFGVRHVAGPRTLSYGPHELVAVTLMRNGAPWLAAFLEHHRKIGIRHFVILDNGSSDGSETVLAHEPDVTLLHSDLPYSAYENTIKRYLVERFCASRWCLFVDIDELFDYPFSDRVPVADLLTYCDNSDYNAVVTQMLDLFPGAAAGAEDDFRRSHRLYCLADIQKSDYRNDPSGFLKMHEGGIRLRAFGTLNGLTKVSLFRLDGKLRPFVGWHDVSNGRPADFSAVLLHYPFAGDFSGKVAEAVQSGRYGYHTDDEYRAYHDVVAGAGLAAVQSPHAQPYHSPEQLLEQGFLVASSRFRGWAEARGPASGEPS